MASCCTQGLPVCCKREAEDPKVAFLHCQLCKIHKPEIRILPCMHCFCMVCLHSDRHRDKFPCPECNLNVPIPDGLEGLPTLSRLPYIASEMGIDGKAVYCSMNGCNLAAEGKCVTCDSVLCVDCFKRTHNTDILSKHVLQSLGKLFEIEMYADTNEDVRAEACPVHGGKVLKYFCKSRTCEKPFCESCYPLHKPHGHLIVDLDLQADRSRKDCGRLIDGIDTALGRIEGYIDQANFEVKQCDALGVNIAKRLNDMEQKLRDEIAKQVKDLKVKIEEGTKLIAAKEIKDNDAIARLMKEISECHNHFENIYYFGSDAETILLEPTLVETFKEANHAIFNFFFEEQKLKLKGKNDDPVVCFEDVIRFNNTKLIKSVMAMEQRKRPIHSIAAMKDRYVACSWWGGGPSHLFSYGTDKTQTMYIHGQIERYCPLVYRVAFIPKMPSRALTLAVIERDDNAQDPKKRFILSFINLETGYVEYAEVPWVPYNVCKTNHPLRGAFVLAFVGEKGRRVMHLQLGYPPKTVVNGDDYLEDPWYMCACGTDIMVVSDRIKQTVFIFDHTKNTMLAQYTGFSGASSPAAVAAMKENIFVSDPENCLVHQIDKRGNLIQHFLHPGECQGSPFAMTTDNHFLILGLADGRINFYQPYKDKGDCKEKPRFFGPVITKFKTTVPKSLSPKEE